MISKVLFTLLVILAAMLFIRHKAGSVGERQRATHAAAQKRQAMFIASALVALTVAISASLYYLHWVELHQVYTIEVTNAHSGALQRYQVYQQDIDGRRFRTIDGRLIHLSDNERMEVRQASQEAGE